MNTIIGIYLIRNIIDGKKYVGQSKNIKNRWTRHRIALNDNVHANKGLQSAWNEYGEENFEFSILEECSSDMLDERETYWILKLNAYQNGYNSNLGGKGIPGYKHTDEALKKLRRSQNPLIVYQFDLDFNLINEWIGGVVHAAKCYGYTKECIYLRVSHKIKEMSPYKGYYWVYKDEFLNSNFSWEDYLNNISLGIKKEPNIKNTNKICQYSLNRELIKTWDTLSDIRKAGFNGNQISSILHKYKNKKTAGGYIWCYEGYDFSDGYFDSLDTHFNIANENRKRKINQIDKNTHEIINTYNSISEAEDFFNVNHGTINRAIRKQKLFVDCYWKYA